MKKRDVKCCGYYDPSVVKWNPFNKVIQCHNCGHIYEPKEYEKGSKSK